MQTVTRRFSASPTICLSAVAQLARPSSSSMPPRLPEKQMTLGGPASAQAPMRSIIPGTMTAWCSRRFRPSGMRVTPLAIAQVRPCFCTGPVRRVEELDRLEADPLALAGEVLERDLLVAPAAGGVAEGGGGFGGGHRVRGVPRGGGEGGQGGGAGQGLQGIAAGDLHRGGGWGGAWPLSWTQFRPGSSPT
jgi:hypothetical protein